MTKPCATKELQGRTYRCYFELALSVIGGKWKPIVLYHLGQHGVQRYSELKRHLPEVTDRMLTRQLRELEADGLIHREVFRQVPPRVEYSLIVSPGEPEPAEAGSLHPRYLSREGAEVL